MRERRWLLLTLYGLLIAIAVSDALKAARPKFKVATTSKTTTTSEEPAAAEGEEDEVEATTTAATETNGTTERTLTGIPQIDYIWDPNLPRELKGYNLSDYPFYASMPEDIDFKCDGLHDGFYASVPHKCQVYHHCLFGTRYDFLCANFTAFDQKTFICHFVSEVDCANSKKYWHRNDALYKTASSSTTSTTTTTTTTTTPASVDKGDRDSLPPRRRRPPPRRPAYDYYDDEYYDDEYERGRPRGYNRRDYDDYEDRKYRRDRDRDRDYRHRDFRDRYPMRGNRRDPARARDPIDDEPVRPRVRDQDSSRTREVEDRVRDGDDRRYSDKRYRDDYDEKESGTSNTEGYVKPIAPPTSVYARPRAPPKLRRPVPLNEQEKYAYSTTTTVRTPVSMDDSLRRPASSEEDEPRRRPAAAVDDVEEPRRRSPIPLDDVEEPRRRPAVDAAEEPRRRPAVDAAEEPRRRPAVDAVEEPRRRPAVDAAEEPRRRPAMDDLDEPRRRPADVTDDYYYYEDEMEEVRPRWQSRGRPMRDRDFPDKRFRDRPFRPRYRDDEDEVRPRKHSDRSRDRFYERDRDRGADRGRDRSLDRTKDRNVDRDRTAMRAQDSDKSDRPSIYSRPSNDRDRESERPRAPARSKDPQDSGEPPKKPSIYDRTTSEKPPVTTTTEEVETSIPQQEEPRERAQKYGQSKSEKQAQYHKAQESTTEKEPPKYWKPAPQLENQNREEPLDDYPSEYYDDAEEPAIVSTPPPRPTVRVVKRPFLPSRGGNPNPRGLSPVGSKALTPANPIKHYIKLQTTTASYAVTEDTPKEEEARPFSKQSFNYKNNHQTEVAQKQQNHNYDGPSARPAQRRPEAESPKRRPEALDTPVAQKTPAWTDYGFPEQNNEANNNNQGEQQSRGNVRHHQTDNGNFFGSAFKKDDGQEQLVVNGNYKVKQKINEVAHHNLQDIPESEYDVTLNEALTPNLSQEPSLPSGFVLPLHRQLGRDAILQPSENSYKFSSSLQQPKQQQSQQSQQQSAFVPSTQFGQQSGLARNADRGKTVYFRTPETIQISGTQYRQQRGQWGDYTY